MQVNVHEAKTHLSRLLQRVEQGEDVVIARAGKPVAKLVAFKEERKTRKFGSMRGQIVVADDFDDALPHDLLALFYGEVEPPEPPPGHPRPPVAPGSP